MAMMDFSIDTSGSPQDVQRKQALADALMKQGSDSTPAAGGKNGGWVTALNRGLAGALGGYQRGAAANEEQQGKSAYQQQLAAALGDGGNVTPGAMIGLAGNPWANPAQTSAITHVADMQAQKARQAVEDQHWGASYKLQERAAARADDKTPAGFMADPTNPGGYKPIAGGPNDPAYLENSAAARARAASSVPPDGFTRQPDGSLAPLPGGPQDPAYQARVAAETARAKGDVPIIKEVTNPDGSTGFVRVSPTGPQGPIPGLTPPASAASTTVTGPDGQLITIPPGVDRKKFIDTVTTNTANGLAGKFTETQGKANQFATRMEHAGSTLDKLDNEGTSLKGAALSALPGGNYLQSNKYQDYDQAKQEFITALLRRESGAAIAHHEFESYGKQFFPQPGDGPEVIATKRQARWNALNAMKSEAGPAYKKSPPPPSGEPVVVDGYTIKAR